MTLHILNTSNSSGKRLLIIDLMNIVCADTIESIRKMLQLLSSSTIVRGVFIIHLPKALKIERLLVALENPTSMPVKTRATDLPFEHPVKELESPTNETMTTMARVIGRERGQFTRLLFNATHLSFRSVKLTLRPYLSNQLVLKSQGRVIV